jgi:hypothetical protein
LLGRFLRACAILKGLDTQARAAAVRLLEQGESVPGVDYRPGRVLTSVSAEAVLEVAESNGRTLENLRAFVHLVAPISGSTYREFAKKIGAVPKSNRIQENRTAPYVVVENLRPTPSAAKEEITP